MPCYRLRATTIVLGLTALSLAGCGGRADLAPTLPLVSSLACPEDSGRLVIEVVNQGRRASRASTTSILFPVFEVRLPTRPLRPGESHQLSSALPEECLQAGCSFSIWIDSKEEVRESNEENNRTQAECPKPASDPD